MKRLLFLSLLTLTSTTFAGEPKYIDLELQTEKHFHPILFWKKDIQIYYPATIKFNQQSDLLPNLMVRRA
jgi:hypothetical protein